MTAAYIHLKILRPITDLSRALLADADNLTDLDDMLFDTVPAVCFISIGNNPDHYK